MAACGKSLRATSQSDIAPRTRSGSPSSNAASSPSVPSVGDENGNGKHGTSSSFNITYSKRALAYELGMSPANLSRLFNVIRDHGVDLDGKTMRITDYDKLTALAHS